MNQKKAARELTKGLSLEELFSLIEVKKELSQDQQLTSEEERHMGLLKLALTLKQGDRDVSCYSLSCFLFLWHVNFPEII